MLLVGLVLILLDRERILAVLKDANWLYLPGALFFIALANSLVTFSYVLFARLIGIRMGTFELGAAFFTTNAMNRVVRSGGAAGFSLRYLMMKPAGVSLEDVLNSSFIHFLLGGLIMLGSLPLVVLYVLVALPVPAGTIPAFALLAAAGVAIGTGIYWLLFSERLRQVIASLGIRLGKKILRRDFSNLVTEYTRRAAWAVTALRRDRLRFSLVMLLLAGEWVAHVLALGYCLQAFGPGLPFGGMAAIFVVPTTAGVFAALPGGIGVQEGVMTSLVVMHGLSFGQATLAAILFRILQSILPYLVSVIFYPRLLKAAPPEPSPSDLPQP